MTLKSSREIRSQMAGLWAIQIRADGSSGLGGRHLCRAGNEQGASDIASRLMGTTHLALGYDLFWISPGLLHGWRFPTPPLGGHCAIWDVEEWSMLLADSRGSEKVTADRHDHHAAG